MESKTAMRKAIDLVKKLQEAPNQDDGNIAKSFLSAYQIVETALTNLLEQEQSDLIDLRQRCAENARIESGNCFKPECDCVEICKNPIQVSKESILSTPLTKE